MKRVGILAFILVVIAAIWYFQSRREEEKIRSEKIENFLNLSASEITKIEISQPSDTVILFKRDEQWYVKSDPIDRKADNNIINLVLENSEMISVSQIISENPERQKEFMVDDSSGLHVTFYNGDEVMSRAIFGKMSRQQTYTFLRKPESNKVYEAEGPISYVYGRPYTGWLDRLILSTQSGNLRELGIETANEKIKLVKDSASWRVTRYPYNKLDEVDPIAVDNYLAMVLDIEASDFINAADSGYIDFDNPSLKLTFNQMDGKSHTLVFSKVNDENSRVYVHRDDYHETFVLKRSMHANFLKNYQYFLKK